MTKFSKITRRLRCHLGSIKQAEVIIHGTSTIHFGRFYKPVNVVSALCTLKVFWAEIKAGQKINTDMRNDKFGDKISGYSKHVFDFGLSSTPYKTT